MDAPVIKLSYQGPPNGSQDFCDHDYLDDTVECDDNRLWAIKEGDTLVGYVCDPHKAAYKREMGIE
jgi:hypothetical protein